MADDENAPATKKDLAELRLELKNELAHMEERRSERIRDSQTEILKAFLPGKSPSTLSSANSRPIWGTM
jgi:hypothetical protein